MNPWRIARAVSGRSVQVRYNQPPAVPEQRPPPANETTGTEEGAITEGHLRATLRFDNGLVILQATAGELKDLMEHSVAATEEGATPGQFPQIAGMEIGFDPAGEARTTFGTGRRIRKLAILNADGTVADTVVADGIIQGDPDRVFRLVTLNFLAEGGDAYPFQDLAAYDQRLNMYEGTDYGEDIDYPDADLAADTRIQDLFVSSFE